MSDALDDPPEVILDRLERARDPLVDLRVERPSLEERFLELTTEDRLR